MKVIVCMGSRCVMMGSMTIYDQIEALHESIPELDLEIETAKCLQKCKENEQLCPIVMIDEEMVEKATSSGIMERIMKANEDIVKSIQ